jgi:hypothetical protein
MALRSNNCACSADIEFQRETGNEQEISSTGNSASARSWLEAKPSQLARFDAKLARLASIVARLYCQN